MYFHRQLADWEKVAYIYVNCVGFDSAMFKESCWILCWSTVEIHERSRNWWCNLNSNCCFAFRGRPLFLLSLFLSSLNQLVYSFMSNLVPSAFAALFQRNEQRKKNPKGKQQNSGYGLVILREVVYPRNVVIGVNSFNGFKSHRLEGTQMTCQNQIDVFISFERDPKWSGAKKKIGERSDPSVAWGTQRHVAPGLLSPLSNWSLFTGSVFGFFFDLQVISI